MNLHRAVIPAPIGRLTLVSRDDVLIAIAFEREEASTRRWLARRFAQRAC